MEAGYWLSFVIPVTPSSLKQMNEIPTVPGSLCVFAGLRQLLVGSREARRAHVVYKACTVFLGQGSSVPSSFHRVVSGFTARVACTGGRRRSALQHDSRVRLHCSLVLLCCQLSGTTPNKAGV